MSRKRKKNNGAQKERPKLLRRMQNKLWITFGIICVLFVALIIKIMYIQYTSGAKYEKIVLAQQEYDSTIIPFQRGNITDCKGTVLATSVDVYNVILDCKVLNANEDKIDSTLAALTLCFPDIDITEVRRLLKDSPNLQYKAIAKRVSYEQMSAFEKLKEEKNDVAGIWFEKEYIRNYPYNSLAAALLGYASSGNTGVIGLENQYNSTLNGVNGRSYGYMNDNSSLEKTVIEPQNGNTVVTTIDVNIQTIVEQAILDFNNEYASEGRNGSKNTAAIVMDPSTGEVLAMATYPTFDLNNPRDLSAYYTLEQQEAMTEEEKLDFLNGVWQNFPIVHTFEPGSTFKPFTVACGLETGALVGNEVYYCNGYEEISDYTIHCVNRNGHGQLDIAGALMKSCNDCLMQMSYKIGAKNFSRYQSYFGFGQKTGIDLPGEASTANLIYDEEGLKSTVNIATNSFGQNFNVTMIQVASAYCSLVNGGYLYKPHVVSKICDSNGNTIEEILPTVMKKTVSDEVCDQMKAYLYKVVESGTGNKAQVEGYAVGGKTGTAEKIPRGRGNYLVSFAGFAPYDDPQVVIYVIVDEPNTADQAHSSYAQQIVKNVLEQILPYLGADKIEEDMTTYPGNVKTEDTTEETQGEGGLTPAGT